MEVIMLNCENYIVLFSGGIDSTYMLLNLLQETKKAQINPNIICLYIMRYTSFLKLKSNLKEGNEIAVYNEFRQKEIRGI